MDLTPINGNIPNTSYNYTYVKTDDLAKYKYLDNAGDPLYPNGATYINGDVILKNGKFRGDWGPLLNDTGVAQGGVDPGLPNAANQMDTPNIFNSQADVAVTGVAQNTISFKNPDGNVNNNLIDIGNITMTGTFAPTGNVNITGNLSVSGTSTLTGNTTTNGNLIVGTTGKQLQIKGGAATDFSGTATLVAGTVTILNTNIAAGDMIYVTRTAKNASAIFGVFLTTITPNTSFRIDSIDASGAVINDLSTVRYVIFRIV